MDILNLPGLKVLQLTENGHSDCRIRTEMWSPSFSCPDCGSSVIGFGKKEQLFMDLPIHSKRTGIVVVRQRYRCKECGKTFLEPTQRHGRQEAPTLVSASWQKRRCA